MLQLPFTQRTAPHHSFIHVTPVRGGGRTKVTDTISKKVKRHQGPPPPPSLPQNLPVGP